MGFPLADLSHASVFETFTTFDAFSAFRSDGGRGFYSGYWTSFLGGLCRTSKAQPDEPAPGFPARVDIYSI